jgi:hypothetical protein
LALLLEQGRRRAAVLLLWLSAGFLVVTSAAIIFYYVGYGLWDLTSPTRELLRTLRDGYIPAPELAWPEVLRQCPFWLAVFLLPLEPCASVAVIGFSTARCLPSWVMWDFCFGVMWWAGDIRSLFYYFSFALPAFSFFGRGAGWQCLGIG